MMLLILIIVLIISAIGKAVMDVVRFHFGRSIFKRYTGSYFFDPTLSWLNKYRDRNPTLGERFSGSTTVFVFITDLWHLAQFIFLRSIFAVVVLFCASGGVTLFGGSLVWLDWIIAYVGLSAIFGGVFWLFYNKILR